LIDTVFLYLGLGGMLSGISNLILFLNENRDLKLLISHMQKSPDDFWLVGGCLRNSILSLPQNDIDITCSGDPTLLIQTWVKEVSAHWFWLDEERRQSRVLLGNGLDLDFTPLRAPTITADLQLRDFTINALALPLDELFPETELLDPTGGVDDLQKRRLATCSPKSLLDDPLRMLKGIRHAVTLGFTLSHDTLEQVRTSAYLITDSAGERVRDELGKIFAADQIVRGVELLIDTGLFSSIFGVADQHWNRKTALVTLKNLSAKVGKEELKIISSSADAENSKQFSIRAVFLLARLLNLYSPADLSNLLHQRLRFSRYSKKMIVELQQPPNLELFSLAAVIDGQRREALLVEQLEPFAEKKMVYWSLCDNLITLERVEELQQSFMSEQKFGRIPDLLNGKRVASLLGGTSNGQISEWLKKIKLAEINGEITTATDAEKWLKDKLSFDKKPI